MPKAPAFIFELWLSQKNVETSFQQIKQTDKTHYIVSKFAICQNPDTQSTKPYNNKKRKYGSIFIKE